VLSLVWCPPDGCCGRLYVVENPRRWSCPESGVPAHFVLGEADWLAWSKPGPMLQLFAERRRKLDLLRDACEAAGLKDPVYFSYEYERLPAHQTKELCDLIREIFGNPLRPLSTVAPTWLAWNDGTVLKIAQAIYDQQGFDGLAGPGGRAGGRWLRRRRHPRPLPRVGAARPRLLGRRSPPRKELMPRMSDWILGVAERFVGVQPRRGDMV
jgi:hypothetical protein